MAVKDVFLTSEDTVRATTNIDNNIQSKFLLSAIREAQEVHLQGIIGSAMLEKLKGLIIAGTIGEDTNIAYKALLDNAQMYLAYQTIVQLCLISSVKLSNGGLQQTTDENLTVLNMDDTWEVQKHYQDKADFFARRLQGYIVDNIKDLPEIGEGRCSQMRATLHSAASTSLWLGGKRGKKYRRLQ